MELVKAEEKYYIFRNDLIKDKILERLKVIHNIRQTKVYKKSLGNNKNTFMTFTLDLP